MDHLRQEKLLRFEEFVDRRLKPDLVKAIAERKKSTSSDNKLLQESFISLPERVVLHKLTLPIGVLCYRSLTWDKVFEKQKTFLDLRRNLENLEKNSVTSLRSLVNLGSEVYMQADVPDTSRIFVDIGLGFHVEFTWSEAIKFIAVREEQLAKQIEEYTHMIASIKAQIKMVYEGIREILQVPAERSY